MTNKRYNFILECVHGVIVVAAVTIFIVLMYKAEGKITPRLLVIAGGGVVGLIGFFVYSVRTRRTLNDLEATLRDSGIDVAPESREPIGLAENRESLIASCIALALIAAVFIAYYAGWIR